eukprot:scaffold2017_cov387-Prasinococcus_capsulatus_cf.AAC.19
MSKGEDAKSPRYKKAGVPVGEGPDAREWTTTLRRRKEGGKVGRSGRQDPRCGGGLGWQRDTMKDGKEQCPHLCTKGGLQCTCSGSSTCSTQGVVGACTI